MEEHSLLHRITVWLQDMNAADPALIILHKLAPSALRWFSDFGSVRGVQTNNNALSSLSNEHHISLWVFHLFIQSHPKQTKPNKIIIQLKEIHEFRTLLARTHRIARIWTVEKCNSRELHGLQGFLVNSDFSCLFFFSNSNEDRHETLRFF